MTSESNELNIPDFLEIKGERIPVDKEDYKNFMLDAGKRVILSTTMEPIKVKLNEQLVAELDMKPFIKIDDDKQGTSITIGKPGLKEKDGLIGLGGYYYTPLILGAKDTTQVIEAWDWLFSKSNIPKKDFEITIEFVGVSEYIFNGKQDGIIFRVMGLAMDLKNLEEMGVNTSEKISELAGKIKGNVRSFNKNKEDKMGLGLFNILQLKRQLSDLSAETVLAWRAKKLGMDVKLAKSPDILIDVARVEVKSDRTDHMDEGRLENKLTKGLKQGGELIAILTGSFDKKELKDFKITWLPTYKLEESLKIAIQTCKGNTKCVLLFSGSLQGFFGRLGIIRQHP